MTELSRTLADLSPEKRALLALRLRQKGAAAAPAEPQSIPRRPAGELAPLSFAQQRFWFLHELQPEVPWYHLFKVIRLHGPLAVPVMEASLRELLRRHEALRTTFASVDGELVQVVSPEPRLRLPVADLSGLPEEAREAEMWRLALAEVGRRFDLAADPLLRGTLLRLAPGTHALVVVMHHIAGDRRSWQLFVQELAALYRAGRTGEPVRLPDLPLQYSDFASWQRRWLAGEVLERQLAYWRGRLGGGLPVLDLPASRPRPPVRSYRGAREVQVLPRELSQAVRELARREGASLFMTLLAAYYALLQRYTGQDDLVVGTPISGRNRPDLDGLIGCFLNTLALRADLGGTPSFRELLGRVRETASGAYAHMDLPFEALLEELRPPRDLARTPVFQVMFVLLDLGGALMEGVSLGDLRLEEFENPQIGAEFDLTLNVDQQGDHLRCDWVYASDLLDAAQVRRLGGHFAALLEAAVAHPDRPLSDLPLLGEAESHLLRIDWNDTATTGAEAVRLVHERIAEQAARTPDSLAVVTGGGRESLTYRELLDRAGRLARHLRSLGAGPEVQIGLCLERDADLPVALLAVLSAGAAYLPLDPDYPRQRLAFMLEDSRVPLLIAHPATAAALPEHGARVVLLEEGWPDRLAPGAWESPAADLDQLAYMIYTSGSTGRPKGVQVPHGALANFLAAMADRPGLAAADRLLAVTSLSFDIAGLEIYLPLLVGASLELAPREVAADGARLLERLLDATTVVQATPSTWRLLLEAGWEPARQRRPLKALCGGEALPADLAARLLSGPAIELWNLYGPTETAIWSLRLHLDPGAPVTLGRPIDNTRLFILDRGFRLVPLGVPGELAIGGDGVARGYFGRPDLTAERFVPDPAAERPGARVYRTGDLARYLDDGRVEFLGRIDHQVKVRGVRIELGEIEAALAEHPAVAQAVVVARPLGGENGDGGASRLVAYLVASPGADASSLSPGELRAFLQRRLPDSMLPALFVPLERLPLTPNGKIDRKALPAPDPVRPGGREIVAPRTPAEETLAAIWRQVLRIDQVGVHDDFFELGGDSILGMQIVARAARAGLGLAPRLLFQHPTIAALAEVADAAPAVHAEQGLVLGSVTPSPAQLQILAETAPADLPRRARWLALETRRPSPAVVWERALAELLRHHDALRLRFSRTDGATGWKVTSAGLDGPVPFERIELPDLSGAAVAAQAERLRAGLDPAAGPLLRAALLDSGPDRPAVLLLVIHELAADRASWRWLLEDLRTACEQLDRGEEVRLPAKTTSFQHWTERLEAHLGGLPRTTVSPLDSASVQAAEVVLPGGETAELLDGLAAAFRVRPDEALLTAIALALAPGGSGEVWIGVEDAARDLPLGGVDASRTVGCCDGDRPLRLEWPGGGGPAEALRAVKEQSRASSLEAGPRPEIRFRGPFALPFDAALQSPPSPGRLEIAAGLTGGGLRLELRDSHPAGADLQSLARRLSDSLAALAALGRDPAAGGYTPSDFPESGLGQADLDRLAGSLDPALRRHIEAVYPFSPSQQGMFFFYLLNPDQPGLFVNQVRCELRGRLDVAALRRAWQTVVDRHAALRTFLLWQGWERPLQVVLESAELPWQEEDWRALAPADQEARLAGFLAADRLRTFDLGRAPLTRVALIRTGEEIHHLVWSFQQLILDGWSLPLVFQEVLALYDAAVSGRAPRLAVGRPYRDYAAWVQRQSLADAEAFWRGRLAGFEEPTPLAVDRPAGDSDRRDAGRRELRLDAGTTAALEALARRSRLTLNTVVEGAWALLLSRYSGEPDVLFGAVVSGRPAELPGVETMVGLFINALPERVEVGLDRPLLPWLAGIQERRVEQTRYEHLPLEQVHRWSALPWNRPLFETLFIFENYPIEDALRERRGGLEISAVGVDERPNYPLNLFVIPGGELFLWVSFEHRRFEEAAVERLLGHLCELLRGFAVNPGAALGAFPLLTAAETGQALAGWNERWAELPPVSVQALIEAQAARRPAAPAVVYEGAGLTYGELNRRANRLAHHLRRLGVGPEVPVGVCLERSLDLIVAVLAVMKAGGAYLPVDIALSSQRMAFVLDDAGVPLVLTRQLLARDRPGLTALAIDAPWDAGDPADDADPPVATVPENACYLIYTSGSTGRPKGVVVRHAGWLNSYLGWEEDYRLPEIAAHLQMAAFSFDVFAGDLVRALCSGGKLVLCPRELLLEPARLYQLMRDEGVEAAEFVPAVVRGLVQHLEATGGRLDFMRLMVCGSDAWYGREFEQLRRLCGPATRLINSYGVSEATIDSSYYEDTGAALGPDALVPIGQPFRACRLLVVAPDLALLPVGVAGELCLGGAGLGRGYLARPELTAEKFVPDPFAAGLPGGRPGDRLYRTGDRARWLPTGDVEFLGRVDHQVKVRGFRVEPGEIESVLGTHPAVRQAAVVARPEPSGERRLVGYVAFRAEAVPPGIQELRDYLRERLPDYMVPSAFAILDALPLTASGKIDRRALPEPEGGRPDLDASYVAPRTQAEEVIAGIFAAVLNLQRVGVEDNFFELGGHSLLATQVVSRVREAFEVDLPLRALFDAPVVARLTLAVEDLILRELEELGDEDLELAGEAGDSP